MLAWQGLVAVWKGLRAILHWAGDIDFVVERAQNPGWVGDVINSLLNLPGWLNLLIIALGLGLIYWDQTHHKFAASAKVKIRGGSPELTESYNITSMTDTGGDELIFTFASPKRLAKRLKMEPSTLIFAGFCVVAIGLVAIAGGIVLQRQKDAPILDAAGQYFEVPEKTTPAETSLSRKKAGLTARHQSEVLDAIEKFRAWLNGPVLEVYKKGDGIFLEQSKGLKDFKSTLHAYRQELVEMGKTAEKMQREYEYAPEVLGLGNWYYSQMYQATNDLMNEIDRVLTKYDDNKEHLENNLFNDRFRRTTSDFRLWIIENKEKLMTLKREYEAYDVGAE